MTAVGLIPVRKPGHGTRRSALWVNGELVYERGYPHAGNYDSWLEAFEVDISEVVHFGESNLIVIRVESEQDNAGITGDVSLKSVGVATNLVANPGFEQLHPETFFPQQWGTLSFDRSDVSFSADPNTVRSGSYSVKVVGTRTSGAPGGPRGRVVQELQLDDADSESTYRIAGWFQTDGITRPNSVLMRLTFYDQSGNTIAIRDNPGLEVISPGGWLYDFEGSAMMRVYPEKIAQGEWKLLEGIVQAPQGSTRLRLELFLWREAGALWWDDIVVERIDF